MFFYNLFLYLLSPFILIRLIIYMIRNSISLEYLFTKLFGTKSIKHKQLWIHAASVGEMKIAIELSRELTKIGQTDILITSNTPTSKTLFEDSKLGNITHCYLPMDFTRTYEDQLSSESVTIENLTRYSGSRKGPLK